MKPIQSSAAGSFIGTWRLLSFNGANVGAHPTGVLIYDQTGHMAVQVMPDVSRPTSSDAAPAPEQTRADLTGHVAYFGTYSVDAARGTVTHHREGNLDPSGIGDVVRRYEFDGAGRLVLTPVENEQLRLVWQRVR